MENKPDKTPPAGEKTVNIKGINLGEKKILKAEDFTIHKMPEKFLKAALPDSSRSTGLFILVLGTLIMAAVLALAYWYFTKDNSKTPDLGVNRVLDGNLEVPSPKQEPAVQRQPEEKDLLSKEQEAKSEESAKRPITASTTEKSPEEKPIIDIATSAPILAEAATSSLSTSSEPAAEEGSAAPDLRAPSDSDQDRLSDLEELLFDSNLNQADSDQDGYDDYSEILNMYNPTGQGGIIANPNIEKFENDSFAYALYYPKEWSISQIGGQETVLFKAANNHFVQVITSRLEGRDFDDWISGQLGVSNVSELEPFYKIGWVAYYSADKLTLYLNRPGQENVFVVSYNPVQDNILHYLTIFHLIAKSLELK